MQSREGFICAAVVNREAQGFAARLMVCMRLRGVDRSSPPALPGALTSAARGMQRVAYAAGAPAPPFTYPSYEQEKSMELRYLCMAILAGNLALPAYASAADTVRDDVGRGTAPYSDRDQMKSWTDERGRLQKSLRVGEGKDYYRQELDKLGYRITAVNKNDPDYLEYEVVKGSNSYEVQIDLDKATGKAKKLDVTTNMWKADSTEQALQDENYKLDYSDATAATSPRYSDRDRMKTWTNEKERLEQTLKAHQAKSYYPQALKDLGYQITAVNDNEQDYVEYEIVKGQDSYEVQIDLDEDTGRAKKVDVTANLWKADATDKALDRRQD
jgi:hypothetical protein